MKGYWINSRYQGKCKECECDISEGDRIFYCRNDSDYSEIYCRPCGEDLDERQDDPEVEI